jgi:hypothetical protein
MATNDVEDGDRLLKYYQWKQAHKALAGRLIEIKVNRVVHLDDEARHLHVRETQAFREFLRAR